ncbi:MAG: 16S rRNA pseudouridine(516) synthase RsuA [Pseudomonadota bacterium]
MRLDKYLCHATGLTRSQAHKIVRRREVTVDGEEVRNPALRITSDSKVEWQGRSIMLSGPRYFMMNKPAGVVSATLDAQHTTVIDLLDEANPKGLHAAGRLDIDTTGLVLISDDGEWTHRITSPRHKCEKSYLVILSETLDESLIDIFAAGIELHNEKGKTKPAMLEILSPTEARIIISEGKYHQVKRMFAASGNHVVALHRERIGALGLDDDLAEGEFRPLSEEEIALF